jgi:preprotein translocase subunit SecB
MQVSPLSLEVYYLKELHFAVNDKKGISRAGFDDIELDIHVDTQADQDNRLRWRCELTIKSKGNPDLYLPYTFVITYVGFFQVSDKFPCESVELLARTNGPALLYSAARETMISLTGRGVFPPLLLPSITFLSPPTKEIKTSHKQSRRLPGKVGKKKLVRGRNKAG